MISIDILTLCEYATSEGSRLSVMGTFDSLKNPNTPFTFDCYLAGKIVFTEDEGTNHKVTIRLLNRELAPILDYGEQIINLNPETYPAFPRSLNFTGRIQLQFPAEGNYFVEVDVDNKIQKSIQVYALIQR